MEKENKKYIKRTFEIEENTARELRIWLAYSDKTQKDVINELLANFLRVMRK